MIVKSLILVKMLVNVYLFTFISCDVSQGCVFDSAFCLVHTPVSSLLLTAHLTLLIHQHRLKHYHSQNARKNLFLDAN